GQPIRIDLAPDRDVLATASKAKVRDIASARSAFQGILPKRFATRWLELHAPVSWTNQALEQTEDQIHEWSVLPVDTEGYEKAEVTAGGVDTNELSSRTMESKK